MLIQIILLIILIYTFVRNTCLDKDFKILAIGLIMLSMCTLISQGINTLGFASWYYYIITGGIQVLICLIYLIFYNDDIFVFQLRWFMPVSLCYLSILCIKPNEWGAMLFCFLCLWSILLVHKKLSMRVIIPLSVMTIFILCVPSNMSMVATVMMLTAVLDQYTALLQTESYHNMEVFQRKLIGHQYEEIKNIYMNMRGWRHDYHNHIQSMKAYLSMNELEELDKYFNQLQEDLDSVDTLVKSGNLMMDAILNSKITIMKNHDISVDFKAILPEDLAITDVDLCVIVGNLLENAIEACEDIPINERFIRIFSEVHGSQFYLSIQNSAKQDVDFNQKNYITNKRGDHGFGMKRVQLLVDKYGGYLNLQNEPGIFASEVTLPLKD